MILFLQDMEARENSLEGLREVWKKDYADLKKDTAKKKPATRQGKNWKKRNTMPGFFFMNSLTKKNRSISLLFLVIVFMEEIIGLQQFIVFFIIEVLMVKVDIHLKIFFIA